MRESDLPHHGSGRGRVGAPERASAIAPVGAGPAEPVRARSALGGGLSGARTVRGSVGVG